MGKSKKKQHIQIAIIIIDRDGDREIDRKIEHAFTGAYSRWVSADYR